MKVYFQASHIEREKYIHLYKKIYDEISKLGYKLSSDEVINVSTKSFYKEIEKGGKESISNLYKDNEKKIQEADINVFETSVPSGGIGFLIEKSLEYGKPTVLLYLQSHPTYFFLGAKHEKLIVKSYSEKNIGKIIKEILEKAKEKRDKRFNFFISPKLLTYLEHVSKKTGITKSKFIRDLIIDHMRKFELS